MKFAHIADCHIGAWRDPKLKDLSMEAFKKALDMSLEKNVDFILIAGDLFNTSLPGIEFLKETTKKLKEVKEKGTPVYFIPGSHDFSPSGKTMLDVLAEAGLMINVVNGSIEDNKLRLKFTIDKKTGAKITGLLGKRGMLDRKYYEQLDVENLENEPGTKIFMFHTALTELKPKEYEKMDSNPLSFLPKGFEYYAGGHVHIVKHADFDGYKNLVYPGPLMPANFSELEKLGQGSFYIYNHGKVEMIPLKMVEVFSLDIDAKHKTPQDIRLKIDEEITGKDFTNTICLIRVHGKLKSGWPNDINWKDIFNRLYEQKAYYVMKNSSKLTSDEFEEIHVSSSSVEDVEKKILQEHLGQIHFPGNEENAAKDLMKVMALEKNEGEKSTDYNNRIISEISKILSH